MFVTKFIVVAVLIAFANSRHLYDDVSRPYLVVEDGDYVAVYEIEEPMSEGQSLEQNHISRVRRQAHGSVSTNPDGTSNVGMKVPLAGNDKNILSAVGNIGGADGKGGFKAAGGGLAWDNV